MLDTRKSLRAQILRWAQRTPVHTFFMSPLLVIAFELALLHPGGLSVSPWGIPTKGYKTRNNKVSDRFIVQRRQK